MESVIIPVSRGGFVAATLWQRHKAKALVIVHPATAVVQDFIKDSLNTFIKGGLVSLLMITGALVFRSPGESVTTKHHVRLDRAGRRMHHRVGESPSPWPYPAGDWAQYWRACRAVIFRLHRPASRRHGCLTRRRDKHYQPNEGKAASMVLTARFGAGTLPALWYMPARRLGLGEDLPAPAMLQWGRWSAMPEYFYDDPEWDARQRAGKITLPILVLGFDDDPWANTEAISRLLAPAQNAK